jgi:hypothetical protein
MVSRRHSKWKANTISDYLLNNIESVRKSTKNYTEN